MFCFTTLGVVHEDLKLFIETNVPKGSKKEKSILGVGDSKIAAPIAEDCGISCQHTGVVPEIIRGNCSIQNSFKIIFLYLKTLKL